MYIDKRVLYIVLGLVILSNVMGRLTDRNALLSLLLTLPAVLIAITFHEFAHGFAADKLGDDTARRQGRLNLNPLTHLDPVGTVMLIFAGFGWGKPIEINPRNFNRNVKMSTGEAIVAAAGPIMNFILAIAFALIYAILGKVSPNLIETQTGLIVLKLIGISILINFGLGIFNLIPLPPLDGSKILKNFLPYNFRNWFENYYNIFYIAFIAIWFTGIAGAIISPLIDGAGEGIISLMSKIFNVYLIPLDLLLLL